MYNGQHHHQQLQHKSVTRKSHLCQVNNTEDMAVISHHILWQNKSKYNQANLLKAHVTVQLWESTLRVFFNITEDLRSVLECRNLINGKRICNDTLRWLKHSVVYPIVIHSQDHLSKTLAEPEQHILTSAQYTVLLSAFSSEMSRSCSQVIHQVAIIHLQTYGMLIKYFFKIVKKRFIHMFVHYDSQGRHSWETKGSVLVYHNLPLGAALARCVVIPALN